MNIKTALLAIVGAALVAAPVLAIGNSHGGGGTPGTPSQFQGTPVGISANFFGDASFDHWVLNRTTRTYQLLFGTAGGDFNELGFRTSQTTGHPVAADTMGTVQMDWNFNNANIPFSLVVVNDPVSGAPILSSISDLFFAPIPPYSFTPLLDSHGNFTGFFRTFYNGALDPNVPVGATLNIATFGDLTFVGFPFSDIIQNIKANGIAVSPNLSAPTQPPQVI